MTLYLLSEVLADLLVEEHKTYTWPELEERFKWHKDDPKMFTRSFDKLRKAAKGWNYFQLEPVEFKPLFKFNRPTAKQITMTLFNITHHMEE